MVKALPFIHQHDRVARKTSDVSAADWRRQTHEKLSYSVFQWKSSYNTTVSDMLKDGK